MYVTPYLNKIAEAKEDTPGLSRTQELLASFGTGLAARLTNSGIRALWPLKENKNLTRNTMYRNIVGNNHIGINLGKFINDNASLIKNIKRNPTRIFTTDFKTPYNNLLANTKATSLKDLAQSIKASTKFNIINNNRAKLGISLGALGMGTSLTGKIIGVLGSVETLNKGREAGYTYQKNTDIRSLLAKSIGAGLTGASIGILANNKALGTRLSVLGSTLPVVSLNVKNTLRDVLLDKIDSQKKL